MNINTQGMTDDEVKAFLKHKASEEGIDLTRPENRYTIWSENGLWSEAGKHVSYEASAADTSEMERKTKECILKTSYSRTMIFDAAQDRLEIAVPDGKVTVAAAR